MATEFQQAMRDAAAKIAKYIEDVSGMTVETKYVHIGADTDPDFEQAKPVARTIIQLDGDNETILPLRTGDSGNPEVDLTLFELHQSNVNTAIEYRAKMMTSLLSMLQR